MIYVPIRTEAALPLSAAIYQLTRPPVVRNPADGSLYYCAAISKPSDATWSVLELPEQETIPVHVQADGEYLATIMSGFVERGSITQQEAAGIVGAVTMLAGTTVQVAALIPPSWQSQIMSYDQAVTQGWIPQPSPLIG